MVDHKVMVFSSACIDGINKQINAEFTAFYAYQALYSHFNRHDVALPGIAAYFKKEANEEIGHANAFIAYTNKRGGNVCLQDIKAPAIKNLTVLEAFEMSLALETSIHKKIRDLHALAEQENETHFASFLDAEFLSEQVEHEDELVRLITTIKHVGSGVGLYLFDRELPTK